VHAKDLQSLRDELAASQSAAAAAGAERDVFKKREADLMQQFEELKRAFHDATEGAAAAVAPEIVEKLKKDAEAARTSEMATRGELCLMKEQLEARDQKLQTLQTQLQAEKQVSFFPALILQRCCPALIFVLFCSAASGCGGKRRTWSWPTAA
jgi:hypothetical protein